MKNKFIYILLICCSYLFSQCVSGNCENGFGKYVFEDLWGRDVYVGDWKDGYRTGKGTYTFDSGNVYVGDWEDSYMHGKGTYTWASGDVYVGDWKDDYMHGKGTYTFDSGDVYVGDYKDDKRTGKGTYTFNDGSIWTGEWIDDEFQYNQEIENTPSLNDNNPSIDIDNFGEYHALFLVADSYDDSDIDNLFGYPTEESKELLALLNGDYNFNSENIKYIQDPTREEIISNLQGYQTSLNENDNLLIMFTGHGNYIEQNKQAGYWIPSDAGLNTISNWVSNADVQSIIAGIPAKNILLIADACYSGAIFANNSKSTSYSSQIHINAHQAKGKIALTAGALVTTPAKSVFSRQLINKLKRNQNSTISSNEIYNQIKDIVYHQTDSIANEFPDDDIDTPNRPQWGLIEGNDLSADFVFVKSNSRTSEAFDFSAIDEELSDEDLFYRLLGLTFLGMPIIIFILFILVIVLGIILIVRRKK